MMELSKRKTIKRVWMKTEKIRKLMRSKITTKTCLLMYLRIWTTSKKKNKKNKKKTKKKTKKRKGLKKILKQKVTHNKMKTKMKISLILTLKTWKTWTRRKIKTWIKREWKQNPKVQT